MWSRAHLSPSPQLSCVVSADRSSWCRCWAVAGCRVCCTHTCPPPLHCRLQQLRETCACDRSCLLALAWNQALAAPTAIGLRRSVHSAQAEQTEAVSNRLEGATVYDSTEQTIDATNQHILRSSLLTRVIPLSAALSAVPSLALSALRRVDGWLAGWLIALSLCCCVCVRRCP